RPRLDAADDVAVLRRLELAALGDRQLDALVLHLVQDEVGALDVTPQPDDPQRLGAEDQDDEQGGNRRHVGQPAARRAARVRQPAAGGRGGGGGWEGGGGGPLGGGWRGGREGGGGGRWERHRASLLGKRPGAWVRIQAFPRGGAPRSGIDGSIPPRRHHRRCGG